MAYNKYSGVNPINAAQLRATLLSQIQVPATVAGAGIELVLGPWDSPNPAILNFIRVYAQAAVTGDATNNFTIALKNRTTGAGNITLASFTSTTNLAAYVAQQLAAVGTAGAVNNGDVLSLVISKNGTGVATPPMLVQLDWSY